MYVNMSLLQIDCFIFIILYSQSGINLFQLTLSKKANNAARKFIKKKRLVSQLRKKQLPKLPITAE